MLGKNNKIFIFYILLIVCFSQKIQEINNICNKINNKYSSTQLTVKDFLLNNNFDLEKGKNFSDEIYNFLIGKKIEEEYEIDYLQIIYKYLLNKYIIPILLLWFMFFIIFIFKKCLCKTDLRFKIILKLSTIFIIIFFFCLALLCSVTLFKSKKLQSSINDASCNLLKFFYEMNHGKIKESNNNLKILDNSKKNDNWPGLFTLNSIILDTSEEIIKLSNKINFTFSFIQEIKNDINEYEKLIYTLKNQSSKGIPNPNINQNNEIFPIYLYEFNNIYKNNSLINKIYLDYSNCFLNPSNKLNYIYNYSLFLSNKSKEFDLQLNDIFDNINDNCYFVKDKSANITNNLIIFQKHSEIIILFIKVVNIICFLFSIINIILIIIYYFKNLLWIKIILHIFWNFSFLIIILFICILYFIDNLSHGFEYSIYLIEKEVLKTNSNIIFKTCLNTINSDLNTIFNIYRKDSALIELDRYYKNISRNLESLSYIEKDLSKLKHVNKAINEINKYINNFELSTNSSYQDNDITFILNSISKLTNNFKEGKNNGFCDTNDIWVSSKDKCKDYKYITRYDIKNKFDRNKTEKYCFTIQDDYKEADLQKIYSEVCKNETYKQITNYILGLTRYYNYNENLLKSLEKILIEIERYHKKLPNLIIYQIKNCENDIGDLIDIYKPILGDKNITNLFKCERLKRKIINYYDICYNQIVNNSKSIKIDFILIILLTFIAILFIIVNNQRNNKENKKRRYMKLQNKDLNNDGVELIEEVPGEDEEN